MLEKRRPLKRPRSTPESSMRLKFQLGEKSFEAPIFGLSKRGMKVVVPGNGLKEVLRPGLELSSAMLIMPGSTESAPLKLKTASMKYHASQECTIRLFSDDDATLAAIWKAKSTADDLLGGPSLTRRKPENEELPRIPGRGIYSEQARLDRLAFARDQCHMPLTSLHKTSLKGDELTGNIENLICGVEIPVGLTGPLLVHGQNVEGVVFAPFATTEGALVASATRGATAITRSGGVTTRILNQRMMRVPLFVISDMDGAFFFTTWVRDHFEEIKHTVSQVSRHAKLTSLDTTQLGNMVHVSFTYETGDAAGQNMTTACTWHACQWIMGQMRYFENIKFENFAIDGNMSGDKKVNFQSFIRGRGIRVTAECFVPNEVWREVLKVEPEQFIKIHHTNLVGGIQIGTVGYNVNLANVIAAIFTATGQDIACVHECSIGHFHAEPVEGGIYISLLLPSLIVGTVGGGTHLVNQHELLTIMGCAGVGKVRRLAEIIAGFCLALEISTGAAIASGQFVSAHERLGRNRPIRFFTKEDLNAHFFTAGARKAFADPTLVVEQVEYLEQVYRGSSIITEMTARKVQKLVGHLPYRLHCRERDGREVTTKVMVKVKPLDTEVVLMSNALACQCGGTLASIYNTFKELTGTAKCHVKELALYRLDDPRLLAHQPRVFDMFEDEKREAYVLVLEYLEDKVLMDSVDQAGAFDRAAIEAALEGAASIHSVYYNRTETLLQAPWIGTVPNQKHMVKMVPLWDALSAHMMREFADWFDKDDRSLHRALIHDLSSWWGEIDAMPHTLVHNDFNPRNLCFNRTPQGKLRLLAYDWEMATVHIPQHDLAEFLAFTLTPQTSRDEIDHYVEFHRAALEKASGVAIDPTLWQRGYRLSLWDLCINRMALYLMGHTFRHYSFIERVSMTLRHLIMTERQRGERQENGAFNGCF